jgi:hypothetical protein
MTSIGTQFEYTKDKLVTPIGIFVQVPTNIVQVGVSVEAQTDFAHVGLSTTIQTKFELTRVIIKTKIKSSMHTRMLQIETRTIKCI